MARQSRSTRMVCYVEDIIARAAANFAAKQDETLSDYIRKLVLSDLKARGLLTPEMLAELLC